MSSELPVQGGHMCSPLSAVCMHARELREVGYTLIEDVIPPSDIEAIVDVVLQREAAQADQRRQWTRTSMGGQSAQDGNPLLSKATGIVPRLGAASTCVAHERLLGVVRHGFGGYVRVSSEFGIVTLPGAERGFWHSDWPYNQTVAAHIPEPYADATLHLSCLLMLTDFTTENGATYVLPGSHRARNNPTATPQGDRRQLPGEHQAVGRAGSALLYDARLWHAIATNRSSSPRLALAVRYAPWWLNLEVRRAGSVEQGLVDGLMPGRSSSTPTWTQQELRAVPPEVAQLFAHWVVD